MTTGINGNDTIGTSVEFELISGLAGDDALFSTHNGAYLIGGLGIDTLSSTVTLAAALGLQTQIGGAGEDDMDLVIDGGNSGGDAQAVVVMDGGSNNDNIDGNILLNSGNNHNISAHFDGGFGADTIDSTVLSFSGATATVTNVTVGGNGNDTVTYAMAGAFAATSATSNLEIYLGNGTDIVTASFNNGRSDGALTLNTVIDGGSGTDIITFYSQGSSFGNGGTGLINVDIAGGNGQDIIFSSVDTDLGIIMGIGHLDTVNVTTTITGDNGADNINSTYDLTAIDSVVSNTTLEGGTSDDAITLDHDYRATSATGTVTEALSIDLGTGDDTLNADLDLNEADSGNLITTVSSSGGTNDITLNADAQSSRAFFISNTVTTGANADTLDLTANVFIAPTGATVATHFADARNFATTGGGDDVITAIANAQASGDAMSGAGAGVGAYAVNSFNTGALNDSITAQTYVSSDFIGGTGIAQFIVDTSTGADTIDSVMSSDFLELFEVEFISVIVAGTGADTITSNIDAFARDAIEVSSGINGGGGNDVINSTIVAGSSTAGTSMTISETIDGGAGNDTITTVFDSSQAPSAIDNPSLGISGGDGNDIISATIIGLAGSLTIDGGIGNDAITVTCPVTSAGFNNITGGAGTDTITGSDDWDRISGDAGSDRIVASGGLDRYWGGSSTGGGDSEADTFVFNPSASNYDVDLQDFELNFDILEFTGLADNGPAGLVDDIDALGMFIDNGAGNSVVFALTAGGNITFIGAGTGAVSSIADLVFDANDQLFA